MSVLLILVLVGAACAHGLIAVVASWWGADDVAVVTSRVGMLLAMAAFAGVWFWALSGSLA